MNDSLDSQTAYWDKAAATKTFTHPLNAARFKGLVHKGARVLDIGCGYGRTLNTLYDLGYRNLVGLDVSRKMVSRGKEAYPHLDLRELTTGIWPAFSDTVDAVILFAVLTCIITDRGQTDLVDRLASILRPGGVLYVSDYWLQTDQRNRLRYEASAERYGRYGVFDLPEGAVFRHHDRCWVPSLFSRFETLHLEDITVTTMNGHRSLGFQYFGKKPGGGCDERQTDCCR